MPVQQTLILSFLIFRKTQKEFLDGFRAIRDDTHMSSMKIVQSSRPSIPLVHPRPKFFHHLDLGRPMSNDPPLQMITNQLKENIIQGWLLYVTRFCLQVGFRFQYQLVNLVWLPCLTSQSKGRFLVINILFGSA